MLEGTRPGGLTALAIINFVFGGFDLLGFLGGGAILAFGAGEWAFGELERVYAVALVACDGLPAALQPLAVDAAVRIRGLSKSFGRIRALDRVTLDVLARSIYGVVGPNEAGKTTLFSVAANFLKPDAGEVEVLGTDVRRNSRLRGRLAILLQDALFQRNVPIVEQLAFFRQLDGRPRREAEGEVRCTLEHVGLGPYAERVHALSHGMVKRLGLAQAFLGEPEVILLDEPPSGLERARSAT